MDLSSIRTYHAGLAQSKAYRVLRLLMAKLLKKHDLTMMQWAVIGLVYEAGSKGVRISDLAKQVDTTLAFITNTVNTLVAKDTLVRHTDPKDSRVRIVTIAPKYARSVMVIERELRRDMREVLGSDIPLKELAIYLKVLDQLAKLDTKL